VLRVNRRWAGVRDRTMGSLLPQDGDIATSLP
jgi:hypothetical protein